MASRLRVRRAVTLPDDYTASKSEWLFLANAFVDFGTWWGITPFVGAGIGASVNTISNFIDRAPRSRRLPSSARLIFDNYSKTSFAWAVMPDSVHQLRPPQPRTDGSIRRSRQCTDGCTARL